LISGEIGWAARTLHDLNQTVSGKLEAQLLRRTDVGGSCHAGLAIGCDCRM